MSVLLASKGFSPALIGLAIGLGSVAYSFALPAWGHVGDVVAGPRRTLQMACLPAVIFALGLAAPLPVPIWIMCVAGISASAGPVLALTDAIAIPIARVSRDYSALRLISSGGAGAGAIFFGAVYGLTGYMPAPIFYVGTLALTVVAAQLIPMGRDFERRKTARGTVNRPGVPLAESMPAHARFGSVGEALSGRPRLVAALVAIFFVYAGLVMGATYIALRVADLGGGPAEVGLVNGVSSSFEVPGLLLGGWLIAHFGLRATLTGSSIGMAACVASWIFVTDPALILVSRLGTGLFFGGICVSTVLSVARLLPGGLQATGQTLLQATGFGFAAVVANMLGGVLYGSWGAFGVFGVAALLVGIGAAVGLVVLPDRAAERERERGVAAPPVPVEAAPTP